MTTEYKTCLKCGKVFVPVRPTRKYCSDACRVGYSKSGNQINADLRTVGEAARRIEQLVRKHPQMVTDKQKTQLLEVGGLVGRLLPLFDKAMQFETERKEREN